MTKSRRWRKKERREPEKTALIDIIFLLLIFFFVSLSTIEPVSSGNAGGGKPLMRKSELPKIVHIQDMIPGLLIQVVDLSNATAILRIRINDLRDDFQTLSQLCQFKIKFANASADGFMVAIVEKKNFSQTIESQSTRAQDYISRISRYGSQADSIKPKCRALLECYPAFYPSFGDKEFKKSLSKAELCLEKTIQNKLSEYSNEDKNPQIHVRMPKKTYMLFIKSLFKILAKVGFQEENIYIRALEERT